MTTNESTVMIACKDLRNHPLNQRIYNDNATADLIESVRECGVRDPIVVTRNSKSEIEYYIISGWRRYDAACNVGLKEVPCIIREYANDAELTREIVYLNITRDKDNLMRVREGLALAESYSSLPVGKRTGDYHDTYSRVAAELRTSNKTIKKGKQVIEYCERCRAEGNHEEADLTEQIFNKSVKRGVEHVMAAGGIHTNDARFTTTNYSVKLDETYVKLLDAVCERDNRNHAQQLRHIVMTVLDREHISDTRNDDPEGEL